MAAKLGNMKHIVKVTYHSRALTMCNIITSESRRIASDVEQHVCKWCRLEQDKLFRKVLGPNGYTNSFSQGKGSSI